MTGRVYVRRVTVERGAHAVGQLELGARLALQIERTADGGARAAQLAAFVHERSGIAERTFELPLDVVDRRTDWYLLVNEATESLSRRTLEKLFAADPGARDADALVVVTSSYAGFPALSRRLQAALELPLDLACFDLSGLGCAGATQGWLFAHALLSAGQARRVSLLLVDVMGTFAQSRRHRTAPSMEQLVAHCLASDGAAALSLSLSTEPEPTIDCFLSYMDAGLASRLWPCSLHLNDLTADRENAPFLAVGGEIRVRLMGELAALGIGAGGEPVFFHPGGAALMGALRDGHPELSETAALSASVLEESGNVGSASAVWVLERALARGMAVTPRFRLVALGPGIVTTVLTVDGVERGRA
jgi:alkylresorcinol/alkylpyrone synthase